jgi:hypothetical protein
MTTPPSSSTRGLEEYSPQLSALHDVDPREDKETPQSQIGSEFGNKYLKADHEGRWKKQQEKKSRPGNTG